MVLDLALRARVHALHQRLGAEISGGDVSGILDLTPGIRSLQVHVDPDLLPIHRLLGLLFELEDELPAMSELVVPSRSVRLPLSWDDPATREAIARYTSGVRDDAPWCPSNIEFIRRVNGLASHDDVMDTVYSAEYLTLGLGDVYLGAPVATPLDPRHRLVTTKYNPARTWTAENSVGIGGAYLCIYGMEGPGGYQFVGRTTQVWSRYRHSAPFEPGSPWLLRFFDRISWYPVTADELLELRADLAAGRGSIDITEGTFSLADHERFLADNADSIADFRERQSAAFAAERAAWAAAGEFDRAERAESMVRGDHRPRPRRRRASGGRTVRVQRVEGRRRGRRARGGRAVVVGPRSDEDGDRAHRADRWHRHPCARRGRSSGGHRCAAGGRGPRCRRAGRRGDSGMTAVERVRAAYAAIDAVERPEIWIFLRPLADALADAEAVDAAVETGSELPLAGLTAAVKNNVDVAGLPTTAACPAYASTPALEDAPAVARLRAAGAVVIGATNLDQFATGLVGTRSPHGAVRDARRPDHISGGSSSGSAVAVALGLVDIAVGTDTAGSGRVPAALQGIVGIKPTLGVVPTDGVVPACRSYDCVTVFARDLDTADAAIGVMADANIGGDAPLAAPQAPVVAVPRELPGLSETWRTAFRGACERLTNHGVTLKEIDLAPFLQAARLLYDGGLVAERHEAVGAFVDAHPDDVDPVVGAIVTAAGTVPATVLLRDRVRLTELTAWHSPSLATAMRCSFRRPPTTRRSPTWRATRSP